MSLGLWQLRMLRMSHALLVGLPRLVCVRVSLDCLHSKGADCAHMICIDLALETVCNLHIANGFPALPEEGAW